MKCKCEYVVAQCRSVLNEALFVSQNYQTDVSYGKSSQKYFVETHNNNFFLDRTTFLWQTRAYLACIANEITVTYIVHYYACHLLLCVTSTVKQIY